METERPNSRISQEEFNLAIGHMEELFDQAMAYSHDDPEKNDRARQLFEDIKKAKDAVELKEKYSALYAELTKMAGGGGLRRAEDKQRFNEILDLMSRFPPEVQGQ